MTLVEKRFFSCVYGFDMSYRDPVCSKRQQDIQFGVPKAVSFDNNVAQHLDSLNIKCSLNNEVQTTDIVLGAQLINACKEGNSVEALRVLFDIKSCDSLVMRDASGHDALFYANLNPEMASVVCAITDKKIVLSTKVPTFHRPCLKRTLPMYNFSTARKYPIRDRRMREVVLGVKLLNACSKGNSQEALNILSEIQSFNSLKIKNFREKSAFYIAKFETEMDDVALEIENKIVGCLVSACRFHNKTEIDKICDMFGHFDFISDSNREAAFGALLVYACAIKDLNGARETLSMIDSFNSFKIKDFHNNTALFYAKSDVRMVNIANDIVDGMVIFLVTECQKQNSTDVNAICEQLGNFENLSDSNKEIAFGALLLQACRNRHVEGTLNILSKITSFDSLIMKDDVDKGALFYAKSSESMADVVDCIQEKLITHLSEACKIKDLKDIKGMCTEIEDFDGVLNSGKFDKRDSAIIFEAINLESGDDYCGIQ